MAPDVLTPGASRPVVPGHLLREVIGRSTSSTVYAARASATGRDEAVKVSTPAVHDADHVLALAAREQAIQQRVEGEHIVRLREAIPLVGGAVALVLDLADGGDLGELVAERGALEPGEVTTVVTPLATTLASLHAAGIVHGDVTPGNVLFTREGKPMLTGFDLARLEAEAHPPSAPGTAGLVAPEVRAGGLPTGASDVWALAALAWFALTGGQSPPTRDVVAVAPSTVGPRFAEVLAPMLAADPSARPSAKSSAAAIYRAVPPVPVQLSQRRPDPATQLTTSLRESARPAPPSRSGRRPLSTAARLTLVLIGGLLFVVVFLVLLTFFGPKDDPSSGSASTTTSARPSPTTTSSADALRANPVAILQGLSDSRANALVKADPALLSNADIPGSPAQATDTAIITKLAQQQQHYVSLAFTVRTAQVISIDGPTAQVVAVIDRVAYTVVTQGEQPTTTPALQGKAMRYTLTLSDRGWRFSAVGPG
ncbi:MAG: protein kinase [Lapillicoccus sp.]